MYIYILSGNSGLYIGISQNLLKRFKAHMRGCKTSARLAGDNLEILHWWNVSSRYLALKVEVLLHRYQKIEGDGFLLQLIEDIPLGSELLIVEALKLPDTPYQLKFK